MSNKKASYPRILVFYLVGVLIFGLVAAIQATTIGSDVSTVNITGTGNTTLATTTMSGTLGVTGTSTFTGAQTFTGNTTLSGILTAATGTFSGTLGVTGTSTFTGAQTFTGNTTLSGILTAATGTFSGTLGVTGTSTFATTTFKGEVTFSYSTSTILSTTYTPAASTTPCVTGALSWDANYLYICTATDTWRRATTSAGTLGAW